VIPSLSLRFDLPSKNALLSHALFCRHSSYTWFNVCLHAEPLSLSVQPGDTSKRAPQGCEPARTQTNAAMRAPRGPKNASAMRTARRYTGWT
jgi:hypothetical protein